jgi:hypothetical protein
MQSLLSNTLDSIVVVVKNEVFKNEVFKNEVFKNEVFKNEVVKNEVVVGITCLCGVKRGLCMPLDCLKNEGIVVVV